MTETEQRLKRIEEKLDRLTRLIEENVRNVAVVYRRTTALAQMVEALGEQREPRLTRAMRAEIDASLRPDEFSQMAETDPEAFMRLYGKEIYDIWRQHGKDGILTMGGLAPEKDELKRKMQ